MGADGLSDMKMKRQNDEGGLWTNKATQQVALFIKMFPTTDAVMQACASPSIPHSPINKTASASQHYIQQLNDKTL